MSRDDLVEALARGDLDELVRHADRLAAREDWDTLTWLRDRCAAAAEESGRQLWAVAHFADYRIALDAPAALAASVITPGAGRFALGPLSEVVAQNHRFDELADHLDAAVRPVVAHERVLRGELLDESELAALVDAGFPGEIQPWEPGYLLPTYRAFDRLDGGEDLDADRDLGAPAPSTDAAPPEVAAGWIGVDDARARLAKALEELVAPWVEASDGSSRVVVAPAPATAVLAELEAAARPIERIGVAAAMRHMAFAAASGGVHGRRRGAAAGRSAAWWVASSATGLSLEPDPEELEYRLETLHWSRLAPPRRPAAWQLGLVIEDRTEGWTAVIDAYDRVSDDEGPGSAGARTP